MPKFIVYGDLYTPDSDMGGNRVTACRNVVSFDFILVSTSVTFIEESKKLMSETIMNYREKNSFFFLVFYFFGH